jgi:murein tripeptide amidase MpaA
MKKFRDHPSIYMHREVMYYSREHREMELITFSGREGITEEREDLIEGMFPEHSEEVEEKKRPFKFDKPTIFLSSRVHPGETPASFVLNGIWKILSNENSEWGKVLREKFVFKIVPMLNPDGVYRGFFRLDTMG